MAKLQAIRGMSDILPASTPIWQYLEESVRVLFQSYGYQEIRLPLLEQTELFKRSIGEVTDIVEKEMYTFNDRNGDSLTLRPEGTAGTVRAATQNGLLYNQTQKLWYCGPMFRHERPQKGRYRQFHQIGVECFGFDGPDIDAELILMTARLWQRLGLKKHITLEINSLGSTVARSEYKKALVVFLQSRVNELDEDSQRRLLSNPLRILDSKDSGTQSVLDEAPDFYSFLDSESRQHFETLCQILDENKITYRVNPRLVRGLDYYCKTVFEWVTKDQGAQGTICAGGRYDGLVAQLGGKYTPGVGFAMGLERLILLLDEMNLIPAKVFDEIDIYFVSAGNMLEHQAMLIAEKIRDQLPELRLLLNSGGGSFKSQLKKADKSGARYALILGDDEWQQGKIILKSLRDDIPQRVILIEQLDQTLKQTLIN